MFKLKGANSKMKGKHLDMEWVKLIIRAKTLGLTQEEIRVFFTENKKGVSF